MQDKEELVRLICNSNKSITPAQAAEWAYYLGQLQGCHLFSAAAQEDDPEGWLRARTHGIGGSDIATIMNENPWSSPRRIWMSKLDMFDSDKQPQQSEAARWGNLLESTVAGEWALRNNKQWIHIPVTLQDDECEWMLANVDGFVLTDDRKFITGILEVKTTTAYNEDIWKEGPLPYYYMCQTNWYCGISGLSEYDIICLVGGQHLYSYKFPADPVLFAREKEEAEKFWKVNVLGGVEPPAAEGDLDKLTAEVRDETAPPVVLQDEESNRVVESFVALRQKIADLEKIKKALYAQLWDFLGAGTEGIVGEYTLSVKSSARRTIDYNQLEKMFPEAYAACVTTKVSNSLAVR